MWKHCHNLIEFERYNHKLYVLNFLKQKAFYIWIWTHRILFVSINVLTNNLTHHIILVLSNYDDLEEWKIFTNYNILIYMQIPKLIYFCNFKSIWHNSTKFKFWKKLHKNKYFELNFWRWSVFTTIFEVPCFLDYIVIS